MLRMTVSHRLAVRPVATALAAALVFSLACPVSPARAAEEDEIAEKISTLEAAIKSKNEQDVMSTIDLLLDKVRDQEKDHKRAAEAIAKALSFDTSKAQIHAAKALADLGSVGSAALKKAANSKDIRSEEEKKEVYLAFIDAIGKTGDEDNVDFLMKLLKDKDSDVIAAAATSLKYYSRASGTVRKDVVGSLVTILEGSYGASQGGRDSTALKKYETISTPMLQTLQELTGQRIGTPPEWRKWFNENKKKKW